MPMDDGRRPSNFCSVPKPGVPGAPMRRSISGPPPRRRCRMALMHARQPDRIVRWESRDGDSRELLLLRQDEDGVVAESMIVGRDYAARYRVTCDRRWHLRLLE